MSRRQLTVTAGPATTEVATLAAVKTQLGISGSASDASIRAIIRAVSAAVAGPHGLRREPWRQTYSEKLPGAGGDLLHLSRWPIQSVASITQGVGDSPTTITASDYSIEPTYRAAVYREDGWALTPLPDAEHLQVAGGPVPEYTVAYVAGWLMPGDGGTWASTTAYSEGDLLRATESTSLAGSSFVFECTTAGTSDSTEPTWPTYLGGTVTDGTAVWTARAAMPRDLEEVLAMECAAWFRGSLRLPQSDIRAERIGEVSISYGNVGKGYGNRSPFSRATAAIVESHR